MGCGFGYLSLASLIGQSWRAPKATLEDRPSWMITDKPKAKHVIFLFMNGGMSQVDTFDYKPALEKYNGQPMPGGPLSHERKVGNLMKSPFKFKKYGKSGTEVEKFSHTSASAWTICASSNRSTPKYQITNLRWR